MYKKENLFSKTILELLTFFVSAALLSACQNTPKDPVIIGKGDGQLEKKIVATATPQLSISDAQGEEQFPSISTALPNSGERIQKTLVNKTGTVELTVDAEVIRYDNQTFPAAVIVPRKFTQQQADKIIQAVVGDSVFYDASTVSHEELNDLVIYYKKRMNEASEDKKEGYQEIINDLEAEQSKAIPESEIPAASKKFMKVESPIYTESIEGKFKKNNREYTLIISNDDDGKSSNVYMAGDFSIIGRASSDAPASQVAKPYDAALSEVLRLVEVLQPDLSLADAFVAEATGKTEETRYAYKFVFTREIHGFHVVYETSDVALEGSEEKNNASYQEPWPYECLSITINDEGVQNLDWKGPCKVDVILNDNVTMLPFEDIMNQFEKMIFVENTALELELKEESGGKAAVKVDRITLGLSRVQSGNKFYLIPVWDFYGTVDYLTADGQSLLDLKGIDEGAKFRESLKSLLTINAIDGSVIERILGY